MFNANFKKLKLTLVLAGLLVAGSAFTQARAEDKAGESGEAVVIPSTLSGVWAGVHEKHEALDATIKAGKLADVHKIAFAIRDYVAAMPKLFSKLTAGKMKSLKLEAKVVSRLASQLDEAGDSGDAAKTKALAERLHKELKKIEALYPALALMSEATRDASKTTSAVVYACSMHPEVTSDKPGKCSKCGMELLKK